MQGQGLGSAMRTGKLKHTAVILTWFECGLTCGGGFGERLSRSHTHLALAPSVVEERLGYSGETYGRVMGGDGKSTWLL